MDSSNRLQHIIDCLVDHRKLWLGATIIGLLSAIFYSFFLNGETWTSRQTMLIRDDLLGQHFKPGSFVSQEAMKSAQETVLETARRPEVIRNALEQLGPETKSLLGLGSSSGWPSDQTVEDFRGAVSFESANGGELGKSDVIVLAAKSSSGPRASKFLSLLLDEVDTKLSEVQSDRFESMEAELRATCESNLLSRKALENELIAMEAKIGPDIGLVRSLIEPSMSSPSAFDEERNQILQEQRTAIQERDMAIMLRDSLQESARKSLDEIPTSAELLAMQPQLADLIAGLAVAKQDLSQLEGRLTTRHPTLKDAQGRVESLRGQIRRSLPLAISGLNDQINARDEIVKRKARKMQEIQDTQSRVSQYRTRYATTAQELQKQTSDLSDAKARLARMQARKVASGSINLLTRIGEPWTGTRPDGLGKRALALAGGLGGLLIGLGLVMIVAPPYKEPEVDAAAEEAIYDEETVSEQRLAAQLGGVLPTRSPEVAESEPEPVQQAPVHSVPEPQPQQASTSSVVYPPAVPATPPVPQPEPSPATVTSYESVDTSPSQPLAETVPDTLPENTVPAEIASVATTAAAATGFGSVAPVDFESATLTVERETQSSAQPPIQTTETTAQFELPESSAMAPSTAEEAYLKPTPRMPLETEPQVAPVEYPTPQQPGAAIPTPQPAVPPRTQGTRPASQTLAAIFANMPQPKTDIGVDDGGDSGEEQAAEISDVSEQIADRILDVTGQQLTETQIPASETQEQSSVSGSSHVNREMAETIQLGPNSMIAQNDGIPLQRRASYRPVDLARVEDQTDSETQESDDQPELSERSIDTVFSQLQQPESRTPAPTEIYDQRDQNES